MNNTININNLDKTYFIGDIKIPALRNINLSIESGEFVAIMGYSGSGKSTLMNIIGCLDKPDKGNYLLDGSDTTNMKKNEYAKIRNEKIGFVFQGFNLLPKANAVENVELPLLYNRSGITSENIRKKSVAALERVGLGDRLDHTPVQLSGGQQQRVAIARALVNSPAILLADEPTGNLDSKTTIDVFQLFQELNEQGLTIILVTHERDFARYSKRIVELRDGRIMKDKLVTDRRYAKSDLLLLDKNNEENDL
ncbi:MAG: macrolide ABC transporter ATP-binding protein [Melioribacteraceae bacterium]|nr:MAG: macrolide ABC transporter ATP-binding protein [Melioribacteraceae bacterium]